MKVVSGGMTWLRNFNFSGEEPGILGFGCFSIRNMLQLND